MLQILFTIVLGLNAYQVIDNCSDQGGVYFSKDDSKENRVLSLCLDTVSDQVVEHELLHICLHQHQHAYATDKELNQHLTDEQYSEEYFASVVAPCLLENQDKLFLALEAHHVLSIPENGKGDRRGIVRRKNNRSYSKSTVKNK